MSCVLDCIIVAANNSQERADHTILFSTRHLWMQWTAKIRAKNHVKELCVSVGWNTRLSRMYAVEHSDVNYEPRANVAQSARKRVRFE